MCNDILFSQVNGLQGIGKGNNPICQPTGTTAEISAGGQPSRTHVYAKIGGQWCDEYTL